MPPSDDQIAIYATGPLWEKVAAQPPDEGSLKRNKPRPAFRLVAAFLFFDPSPAPLPQGERELGYRGLAAATASR
jgi:hypothetical protein